MKSKDPIPEVSPLVHGWMSNASEDEKKRATVNFRNYLAVAYGIFERLEAKGHRPGERDNSERYVRVDASNKKGT